MAVIKKFNNGCGVIELHDLNFDEVAQESLKKDLIDWCKADRKEWLKNDLKAIYDALYMPTRKHRFDLLSDEEKKKPFGISMDTIKSNAMLRYAIARVKLYGSKENFIKEHGEFVFNRLFVKEKGSSLDTRWESIEGLIKNGFD